MVASSPGATSPLSNEPSLAVTVCACAPMLVQVNVPPTGTHGAKPHELMSEELPSTIAAGASDWATATAGTEAAANAAISSPTCAHHRKGPDMARTLPRSAYRASSTPELVSMRARGSAVGGGDSGSGRIAAYG